MASFHLLSRSQRAEITWQIADTSVVLVVASGLITLVTQDLVAGILTMFVSLVCIAFYFGMEQQFEHSIALLQHTHLQHKHQKREYKRDLIWAGVFTAGAALSNFFLAFARSGVSPANIPKESSVYGTAFTMLALTIVLCVVAHTLQRRIYLSKHLQLSRSRKNRMLLAYLLAGVATLVVAHFIYLASPYPQHAPTQADWGFALLGASLFVVVREFQLWDRKHHRKAIHELHHELQTNLENIQ
jgi:magnesium-transporting ATPase (P-type)